MFKTEAEFPTFCRWGRQDLLTLGSRLAEEIQMRCRVQDQLAELKAQLTKVSKDCDEAQSRANDLEQQLNSALEIQAPQQTSNQFQVASILPDVRPTPDNPGEFTPENFIWAKQQWDRVAEENLRLDNSLHIASAQKHRLETEVIRLSRELENYQKRNIGHGRSMNDAAQQTKEEPPRMTTVATQTDFVDQNNTESKPIEPEHQAVPLQQPRIVMTDATVQAVEQPDEHIMSDELPNQTSEVSGALEVTVQEFTEERIDKEFEVCVTQKASEASSSQTAASKGKGIACQPTMSHDEQSPMTLHVGQLQPIASNTPQEYRISELQWVIQPLRCENDEMRNALNQYRNDDSRSEGPESQLSDASPEEVQARNTDPKTKVQDADVEMGGLTAGQHSTAQQSIEAPVVPAIPPATSEAGEILRFNLQHADEIVDDMSGEDEIRGD
ncbi:hypothetical protein FMUND_6492 [Fusarium mundagurra]|uniref:Uncharacterized protein n=1 Tax=Fusarium mundagurra TaxID=1567541 RepID=A0A8H5YPZ0_9HYPO|nr:hypothetical protein FMUND_6492 [Fusarium mundagurra]